MSYINGMRFKVNGKYFINERRVKEKGMCQRHGMRVGVNGEYNLHGMRNEGKSMF